MEKHLLEGNGARKTKVQLSGNPNFSHGGTLYVGIDMHQNSWSVAVLGPGAVLKKHVNCAPKLKALLHILSPYKGCEIRACYEAGGFGYWLRDELASHGINVSVVPPSKIYRQPGERVKTDRRDSLTLAAQLSMGLLDSIVVPDKPRRAHRQILRLYDQIKKDKQRVMVRLKAFLRLHGIEKPPTAGQCWSRKYIQWLKQITFQDDADNCLAITRDTYVRQYESLRDHQRALRSELSHIAKLDRYKTLVDAICRMKGVGKLTATRLLLEVGKFSRFPNSRKFTSYLGLTPSERSSGDKVRRGPITRCGNPQLRSNLIEISWIVIRYNPSLADTYRKLAYRRGSNIAIVAIARKLAIRLYWLVREEELLMEAE